MAEGLSSQDAEPGTTSDYWEAVQTAIEANEAQLRVAQPAGELALGAE